MEKSRLEKLVDEYLQGDYDKPMCILIAKKTKVNGDENSVWIDRSDYSVRICNEKSLIVQGDSVDEIIEKINK